MQTSSRHRLSRTGTGKEPEAYRPRNHSRGHQELSRLLDAGSHEEVQMLELLELLHHTHQLLDMLQQAGRFLGPSTGELQFVFHFPCKLWVSSPFVCPP